MNNDVTTREPDLTTDGGTRVYVGEFDWDSPRCACGAAPDDEPGHYKCGTYHAVEDGETIVRRSAYCASIIEAAREAKRQSEEVDADLAGFDTVLIEYGDEGSTSDEEQEDDCRFADAPEFEALANRLISEIGQHRHYAEARVRYLWRKWGWNRKGRPVIGAAQVMNEEARFLTGYDIKLVLNHEMWEAASEAQRRAMVDHVLCMIYRADDDKQGNPVWRKADPDYVGYNAVIRRHGLWTDDLVTMMASYNKGEVERAQMHLDFTDEKTEPQDAPTSAGQSTGESGLEAPDNNTMPDDTTNPSSPTHLEAPGEAHTRSEGKESSEGTTPPHNIPTDATGVFSIQVPDYEETGLPLVAISANVTMEQLAEMAYQGQLGPCVIELTRTVQRGTGSLSQTTLYHYQGPGHDPVIRRITTPMHKRWVESMREARTSAVGM